MTGDTARVGVLSLHNSKETKAILNAIEDLGHEPFWLRKENTAIEVTDGHVSIEPDVDVVLNRLLLSNTDQPAEHLGLATTFERIRPMLNEPDAVLAAIHKFAAAATLADWNVPVPDALLALSNERLNQGRERFGDVGVYKTAIGTHGGGTWKVDLTEPVNPKVGNRQAFLQRLIERDDEDHRDLRVYVVGDEIVGAMYRYAPEGDWRTNVALGGDVENALDDMPDEAAEMALYASEVMGLDYAGVDLIEGYDGWYVLEVNPTAGFKGLFEATGVSPAPHIAKLAIEKVGGTVDEDRVEMLAGTLDDSRPSCAPPVSKSLFEDTPIIGYIEEVVATGTSGSVQALAKSDTGATRTSIDTSLAAEIGAGPIKSMTRVKSGSNKSGKARPVVDLVIGIGGTQHTVTASVEDRGHMEYPLLLGRDILEHYRVDVRKRVDDDRSDAEDPELLEE
ncbi:alpha-L-glutamate ligase, RimK family [Halopenitus malekzadehii]|uniref:Alpha-L-glutamate ligase, RimK family n=1 Tax=Halopenitus malekzadehii TaxID=1267564 RepID=A0A1H6ILI1_9EURY|nr:RimK family alpha-L-glutamate ligase [Halopenitus malekzadehii]SEH47153.1 alpha-L-glutamate ligase, RimK family [Halopenitus malekzadehii]